jgi:hypothetical protein
MEYAEEIGASGEDDEKDKNRLTALLLVRPDNMQPVTMHI